MDLPPNYSKKFERKTKSTRGPNSERAELVGRIEKFTNPSRLKAGYRPYSFSRIGDLVSHLSKRDLRDHVVQSEKADEPGRYFWGKLKVK
jgi:hypothetical protein